jgi:hypothetical protein
LAALPSGVRFTTMLSPFLSLANHLVFAATPGWLQYFASSYSSHPAAAFLVMRPLLVQPGVFQSVIFSFPDLISLVKITA